MKELLIRILNFFELACWIEIFTDTPRCTYYFGPFLNEREARLAQDGYIEDLENEEAKGISVNIKRFKPNELTIFDDLEEMNYLGTFPHLDNSAGIPIPFRGLG